MRVMLKATLDTEKSNELIRSGKMPEMIKEILDHLKPEAAYFAPLGGRRTCLLFFDMKDSSELPPVGEPFLTEFNAEVEVCPIMNSDDLQKGLSQLR
ncbi:hypothetical protein OG418_23970 [Streptomyces phaeochromogenes]|uniref:Uncharacterized protein n=1 Tax=Streptomyces phaeochromogenes TaxID=1923 RepID=A0ABZ1HH07_STRPH|nr:hypothetical protein [Streptomyces phaeochromogenes]MCX5605432.1 hypothetical protein [Streptomyces phaeochromogenes]WRZ31261.1 hypothetical protein OG931_27710 [Streptomyces phaeochromogenes]WSD16848.1 hypothetical protein OHB35_28370 [Streptomyces phaeochromogenes]WSJ06328.1 hypothetical protein OG437_23095 [Streptomyces phaeochromogenes]